MKIKTEDLMCPRFSVVGLIAVGAVSFGVGYLISAKRSNPEELIEVTVEDHNQLVIQFERPTMAYEQPVHIPKEVPAMVEDTVSLIRHSIFPDKDESDEWDAEKEEASRKGRGVYIIHQDEFFGDELGYSQMSLNYYEEDDILCDDDDVPIYNYEQVVGRLEFGHGTDDKNVVYVRNDARECEYEILRNTTSYANEVLGIEYDEELDREIEREISKLHRKE